MATQDDTQTTRAHVPTLERIPTAAKRMGVSSSQVYKEIRIGRLGPLIKLGERASALTSDSVDTWINNRINDAQRGNESSDAK